MMPPFLPPFPTTTERPDVAYSLVAVDFLPPPVINNTLHKVAQRLASGVLNPLRSIGHGLGVVASAFRQMVQATHVGKVVVAAERSGGAPPAMQPRSYPAVAITGGSGGLGLMISQWLVQRNGHAYILLLSRSGRIADMAASASLASTSACVSSSMSDTGAPVDAAAAFGSSALRRVPPLHAVLHASGVLADSLLVKQSAASFRCGLMLAIQSFHAACQQLLLHFGLALALLSAMQMSCTPLLLWVCFLLPRRRVFAPKLGALGVVSAALQRQPVATLALFSSVASLLGAAGQVSQVV